jgi:predicted nucleotidyltransferase
MPVPRVVRSAIDDLRPALALRTRLRGAPLPLPAFNEEGDLPTGVHRATLAEILGRFGQGSVQRRAVSERLKRIYQLVASTGHLARFVVFGSFVTAEEEPGDVDVVLLMEDTFDLSSVAGEAALVFQHMEADAHFGASVFWTRRSGAIGGEQAMIEYWQVRRDGGRRGIVEIVQEEP